MALFTYLVNVHTVQGIDALGDASDGDFNANVGSLKS